jgi:glycosyltransferase involved in cell wall biosynthesis
LENKSSNEPTVSYVIVNNLGGITTMLDNIIKYRQEGALTQEVVLLNIKENPMHKSPPDFATGIPKMNFNFSKKENWYSVYGKLSKLLNNNKGVIIANDEFEMIMLSHFNIKKKVVQIIHDAYNVKLAVKYGDVVDAFVCHTVFYYEVLRQLFPDRRNDIYHIPYGVPILGNRRTPTTGNAPLKLIFIGRHDRMKGIYDLLEIENILRKNNVETDWLILGKGVETENLKKQWSSHSNVRFYTPDSNAEVLKLISERDIFVFPTKFEGFPVSLVEAMSVGCVPVASDLPGGMRELVRNGINGFLCPLDDNQAFAEKIIFLNNNREALNEISNNAYTEVSSNFNAVAQSPKYQNVFKMIALSKNAPRHHNIKRKLGSRLDQPWLPNFVTNFLRRNK